MTITVIAVDDLSDGKVIALLNAHRAEMFKYSPPESIHALDEDSLIAPSMTFWSAKINQLVVACGGLKELSDTSAEIKSMKTNTDFLRLGIAEKILMVIIAEAKRRDYSEIFLETGSHEAFLPAIKLYEKYGFQECRPFGDYKPDPYSRFFKMILN